MSFGLKKLIPTSFLEILFTFVCESQARVPHVFLDVSPSNMALIGGEPGTGTGRLLATYFGEHGPFPTVSMQLGSTEAVKQAVKVGLGASLVLESSVREEVQNGSLVAIPVSEPGLSKELMVIYPSSLDKHRPVYSFVGHLCE